MNADLVWWKNIVDASKYIDDIRTALLKNKSVLLTHTGRVPWYSTMQSIVVETVGSESATKSFRFVEDSAEPPGKLILEETCSIDIRSQYRSNRMTYEKFLAQCDDIVLNNEYVWITGISPKRVKDWISFVSEYNQAIKKNGKSSVPGVFILDTELTGETRTISHYIEIITIEDYIDDYDINIFDTLISSSLKQNGLFKKYLSSFAANIARGDVELSALCIASGENLLRSPKDILEHIATKEYHTNGLPFLISYSENEINSLLWKSQMEVVFPLYEEFREYIINYYKNDIYQMLPLSIYNHAGNEVRVIENIYDLDLGNIYTLARKGLHFAKDDYNKLLIYKDARNKTAHFNTLSYEEVYIIFNLT